jgi:hypothetical protein
MAKMVVERENEDLEDGESSKVNEDGSGVLMVVPSCARSTKPSLVVTRLLEERGLLLDAKHLACGRRVVRPDATLAELICAVRAAGSETITDRKGERVTNWEWYGDFELPLQSVVEGCAVSLVVEFSIWPGTANLSYKRGETCSDTLVRLAQSKALILGLQGTSTSALPCLATKDPFWSYFVEDDTNRVRALSWEVNVDWDGCRHFCLRYRDERPNASRFYLLRPAVNKYTSDVKWRDYRPTGMVVAPLHVLDVVKPLYSRSCIGLFQNVFIRRDEIDWQRDIARLMDAAVSQISSAVMTLSARSPNLARFFNNDSRVQRTSNVRTFSSVVYESTIDMLEIRSFPHRRPVGMMKVTRLCGCVKHGEEIDTVKCDLLHPEILG